MHEPRTPSDKEIHMQALRLTCREMPAWKHTGGAFTVSAAHTLVLNGQNRPKTLSVQPIHVLVGLIYWPRGDNQSLSNGETKGSLMGNLTSGQNIRDSGECGQSLWY